MKLRRIPREKLKNMSITDCRNVVRKIKSPSHGDGERVPPFSAPRLLSPFFITVVCYDRMQVSVLFIAEVTYAARK